MSTVKPRASTTLASLHPLLSTSESRLYSTQLRLHTCIRRHADVIQQRRAMKTEEIDNRQLLKSNTSRKWFITQETQIMSVMKKRRCLFYVVSLRNYYLPIQLC